MVRVSDQGRFDRWGHVSRLQNFTRKPERESRPNRGGGGGLGGLDVDGRIKLNWVLNKVWGYGLDPGGLIWCSVADSCENYYKFLGSISVGYFLTSSVTTGFSRRLFHGATNYLHVLFASVTDLRPATTFKHQRFTNIFLLSFPWY
jgi:hypothetical protein